MITTALIHHSYPISRILLTSSKISIPYALLIFNQLLNPTTFLYNTMISSLTVHKDHIQTALSLYSQIFSHENLKPNSYTYPSLLKACGSHPWLNFGLALHTHVIKFLEPTCDNFLHASLLSFYSKMGKLGVSRHIFNQISRPDLATWNAILGAYAHNSSLSFDDDDLALEALSLFKEMQRSKIRPNELTLVALVGACAELGYLSQGVWAHVYVLKNNLRLNHYVGTSLIDMYSKCGCLSIAYQLFGQLSHKDTLCYNAMIRGFATHGFGRRKMHQHGHSTNLYTTMEWVL
ncbi:Pentatricopeptide repeat [Dillenia turbinata]|uniref:Pentatricopeptide repeat n=1 Tax=Dillenia turbinata TaxID=194707 RepID=A0AAN8UEI0_9MAGN